MFYKLEKVIYILGLQKFFLKQCRGQKIYNYVFVLRMVCDWNNRLIWGKKIKSFQLYLCFVFINYFFLLQLKGY